MLARMRQCGELLAPLVTVVTDEHPHAKWLHCASDLTFFASESARTIAISAGLSPDAVPATARQATPPHRHACLDQRVMRG